MHFRLPAIFEQQILCIIHVNRQTSTILNMAVESHGNRDCVPKTKARVLKQLRAFCDGRSSSHSLELLSFVYEVQKFLP